ncbi:MAG: DMT family transporter [Desulfovibrio sp.]|uniref:DMT family transporter n=1 Tax=Desulfovibrio sp. 7SRBS1 TaxID=3378064 RepID=UPI003B3CAE24
MKLFYICLALAAGFLMPVQAGINSILRDSLRAPESAALVSFFVGTVALTLYVLVVRLPFDFSNAVSNAPWWSWLGGVLGAFFVTATVILVPKVGAGTMAGLIIAGQLVAAVFLDHFGVLGYQQHSISLSRILGVAFLVLGAIFIRK